VLTGTGWSALARLRGPAPQSGRATRYPATSRCQPVWEMTTSMAVANDANSVAQIMMKAQNSLMVVVHAWNRALPDAARQHSREYGNRQTAAPEARSRDSTRSHRQTACLADGQLHRGGGKAGPEVARGKKRRLREEARCGSSVRLRGMHQERVA
jgi:hypothetical protein